RRKNEFFLHVRALAEIVHIPRHFNGRITRDHTKASTRRVQEDTVKSFESFQDFPPIIVGDNGIAHAQTKDVRCESFSAIFFEVISHQEARVLHFCCDVCSLTTRCSTHVQNALVLTCTESHDREEGRCSL